MPQAPDPSKAVILNLFPGDTLEIWITGKKVWVATNSSAGALLVGESDTPIKGISDKHWKFVVKSQFSGGRP